MKLLVIIMLVVGVVLIINGYLRQNQSCPPPTIVYKYLNRDFAQEQDNPVKVTDVFRTMFADPGPLDR